MSAALTPPVSPAVPQALSRRARPRRRWELWRSPAGQSGWARPALLAVAALAALLYTRNIASADLAPYYSVAVKSMSESWKAFCYGAFDPAATITIDKLAGAFVPQALSARIFGFHPWSLALPQVIEGVVTVLVMYRAVRQWAGEVPGLLAALLLTLTPIVASVFGHPMEDGALTLCLVLAADAWQRAVVTGRLRPLTASGVWVGLGFQAKMLQAWMILPALFIGYLVAVPRRPAGDPGDATEAEARAQGPRLGTRLWQLAVAGLAMLAVSLSWILLFTITPAADRPYVDGSTDNSAFAMVFGYNGLDLFGVSVPGAVSSGPGISTGTAGPGGYGGPGGPFGLPAGSSKLLSGWYGPQAGWLYPLACLGLVAGLYLTRRARRGNPVRCGFLMWGMWLCTAGLVFSLMTTLPHTAYLAMLAPPVAALAAAGIYLLVLLYRTERRSGWLLPAAVAAEVLWAAILWRGYPGFLPRVQVAVLVAGLVAAAALTVARLAPRVPRRAAGVALAVGIAAMLAAPASWSASVLDANYTGTSFDASAGPPARGPRPVQLLPGAGPWRGVRLVTDADPADAGGLRLRQRPPRRGGRPARRPVVDASLQVHPGHRTGGAAAWRVQRHGAHPAAGPGPGPGAHRTAAVLLVRLVRRTRHRRRGPGLGHGRRDRLLGTRRVRRSPGRRLRKPAG